MGTTPIYIPVTWVHLRKYVKLNIEQTANPFKNHVVNQEYVEP